MPNTHGGARPGAGRPQETYEDYQPKDTTPIEWLWGELARRFGQGIANEIHQDFNAQKRAYEQKRRDTLVARREQERRAAQERTRK